MGTSSRSRARAGAEIKSCTKDFEGHPIDIPRGRPRAGAEIAKLPKPLTRWIRLNGSRPARGRKLVTADGKFVQIKELQREPPPRAGAEIRFVLTVLATFYIQ